MQIHISRDGQQFGPYTLEQIREYLKTGQVVAGDLAWYHGAAGWVPLSTVPGVDGSTPLPISPGASAAVYHHVSKFKFILYSIVSFGLYEIYWFYKNWKYVKQRDGVDIRPFWRGLFSPIWCYSLCKDISENGGVLAPLALVLVPVFYLALVVASRLPDPYWLISLASFAPLLVLVGQINRINRDRGVVGPYYSRFGVGPILLSLLGAGLLALIFVDLFRLVPSTKVVPGSEMSSADLDYLRSAKIIESDETVLFFYSTGLFSMQDEGNVLTDRRVISYEKESEDSELTIAATPFARIKDIGVEYGESTFDDTIVTVTQEDDEEFLLLLSTEEKGDRRFVDRLMELWNAARQGIEKPTAAEPAPRP
jgi:hypothetical protein